MRTQTPTSPFDVVGVDVARYGTPQHETSITSPQERYGPPQHEQHVEDPDWLISIARRTFSVNRTEPVSEPKTEPASNKTEPVPNKTEERTHERAIVRL